MFLKNFWRLLPLLGALAIPAQASDVSLLLGFDRDEFGADERNRTSDLLSTTPLRSKHQKPFKGSRNLGLSHTIYSIAPPAWTATQSA
jgi:hypothetical protein